MFLYARLLKLVGVGLLMLQTASVTASTSDDPWEGLNRSVFTFNDYMDRYMLKPVAKGYKKVTPGFVDDGITNMFANMGDVVTLLNEILQLKMTDAGITSARIFINSTIGLFGFFDVASKLRITRQDEDFGQTFQYWGVPRGPYVVLPLLGPSTVTDAIGRVPRVYTMPSAWLVQHERTSNVFFGVDIIDTRADLLKAEELISGDRYIFLRDAYLQRRAFLVNDGDVDDDFGEEDFEEFE